MANLWHNLKLRFIQALARRLPPCREIVPLISQAQDRPLAWRERLQMRLHLFTCRFCTRYLLQLNVLRDTVRTSAQNAPDSDAAPRLSQTARARLAQSLDAEKEKEPAKHAKDAKN